MDAVSVETSPENEWIKQRIVDGKVSSNSSMTSVHPIEFDKNLNRFINFLRLSFLCPSSFLFMNLCHAFKHLIINQTVQTQENKQNKSNNNKKFFKKVCDKKEEKLETSFFARFCHKKSIIL